MVNRGAMVVVGMALGAETSGARLADCFGGGSTSPNFFSCLVKASAGDGAAGVGEGTAGANVVVDGAGAGHGACFGCEPRNFFIAAVKASVDPAPSVGHGSDVGQSAQSTSGAVVAASVVDGGGGSVGRTV